MKFLKWMLLNMFIILMICEKSEHIKLYTENVFQKAELCGFVH